MVKVKTLFQCRECGVEVPQYLGRCPECMQWNTFDEKQIRPERETALRPGVSGVLAGYMAQPQQLSQVPAEESEIRYTSGFKELDRVLGGGFLAGAYLLFGGDPGIGKSTLMLQTAQAVADIKPPVMYVTGEESLQQVKLRAKRLELDGTGIVIVPETNIHKLLEHVQTIQPVMVIIDSIQSVYDPDLSGTPGTVSQIRDCAGMLMSHAKAMNITMLLVGHVTKEGSVAGPKLLEHLVDGVFYMEGEKYRNLRVLRTAKNRFGNTSEIGIFEMGEAGLAEVDNPSELFLTESSYQHDPGSVITAVVEGNRPLLVEIQALTGFTTYPSPRRIANGIDMGRLHQIVAVLERRLGMDFSRQDVYVNVVGGLKIQEPAADLAVAVALVSSSYQVCMRPKTIMAGEIGLTGEIRPVGHMDARVTEAEKLGFTTIVLPASRKPVESLVLHGIQQVPVRTVMEALRHCLDQTPDFAHNHIVGPPRRDREGASQPDEYGAHDPWPFPQS